MPDEIFHNRPSDNPAPDPYLVAEADLVNRHNLENQRLELLSSEVQRLRSRQGLLSGLSVAVLILAGVLAGLVISMKLQQDHQRQKAETLTGDQVGIQSQVKSLNQQVKLLNRQVASLNQQVASLNQQVALKASQAQIKPLQAIIQDINSKYVTRVQLNTALQEVQQKLSNGGSSSTPSPAFSPSP